MGKLRQQGDVLIFEVSQIKGKKRAKNHLAEGEATGHYHEAVGEGVLVLESDGEMYIDAPNGATVTHQEHKHIELPPGKYRVGRVLEYDHFAEEARRVQD